MNPKATLHSAARGFQLSTLLLTCCELGVFAALGRATRTAEDLAKELGLDARGLEIVLLALAAAGFLARERDGFRVPDAYAPYLLPDSPETQASILNHNYHCLLRWAKLADVLRTGEPAPRDAGPDAERQLCDFICGMANVSREASAEVAAKVDLSRFRRMLDLGGGPATASIVFAQKYPELSCVVFDLGGPVGIAREEIDKAGMADRIETRVADYYVDDFGSGFDLVYISNIIHSCSPDDTAMIARKARDCLHPAGAVMVKEFFLEDDRITPACAAMFSVNMLVSTPGGKSYTLTETRDIFAQAGFVHFEIMDFAMGSRLLIGRKT